MRSPSTRLLAALPLAVAAALVLAPAAHATATPQPAPPPIASTPASAPAPATSMPTDPPSAAPVPAVPATVVPAEGRPGQVSRIPQGAPETGGGATADDPARTAGLVVLGGLGLAGAGTALALRRRTPRADRG